MAEVEYRNQIVACAHAARLDGMIILSGFRHGDLSRNVEDRRKIRRILKVKNRLPTSSRLSMTGRWLNCDLGVGPLRQASISPCVAWRIRALGPARQLRSDLTGR